MTNFYFDIESTHYLSEPTTKIVAIQLNNIENNKPTIYFTKDYPSEKEFVKFILTNFDIFGIKNPWGLHLIGFNIKGFDLPFLYYKCKILGLVNELNLPPFETIARRPYTDLQPIALAITKGDYKNARLSNMCKSKQRNGDSAALLAEENKFDELIKYCEEEYIGFKEFYNFCNTKIPHPLK